MWLDMSHLLHTGLLQQRVGGGVPAPPPCFSDLIDNKCDTSSHLGEGRCKRIWCQKFEFVMYFKINDFQKKLFTKFDRLF